MKLKNTVLIVDDEPITLDIMGGLLAREGCDLVFASNGEEALAKVKEANPDVILLDVMMPDMDGFEVCRKLKEHDRWRHIPIILVTALGSKEDMLQGFEVGADDFLHKPVSGPELRLRVRSMLRIKNQYDELEEALHLREELAHLIVHDMRNPITTIIGICELSLMKAKVGQNEEKDEITQIHSQARRLNSFLNDMLIVAKMEAGELILHRSKVNLGQFIEQVVESHQIIAQSRNIRLEIDIPNDSLPMFLDESLFQRVLDNLVSNALKFSPTDNTVQIRVTYPDPQEASSEDSFVKIEVIDRGPGVPEEYRERIFDKFEIVAMRDSVSTQFGLGLAFCKMVVEAHEGKIYVIPNEPEGANFTVEIKPFRLDLPKQ